MPSLAIADALDLARAPAIASLLRRQPIGRDIRTVILIASGSKKDCQEAAKGTRMHPMMVRDAAILYIQQILFHPSSDAYRVLGCGREADRSELRENMRLLLMWLHPDRNQDPLENVFIDRVLNAWREISSEERLSRQDRPTDTLPSTKVHPRPARPMPRAGGRAAVWVGRPYPKRSRVKQAGRLFFRGSLFAVAAGAVVAIVFPELAASFLSWLSLHEVFGFAIAGEALPRPR